MGILSLALLFAACGNKDTQNNKNNSEAVEKEEFSYEDASVEELEVKASDNDLQAIITLANRYDYGNEDVSQDFEKAKTWYLKACDLDSTEAMCVLGYYSLNGLDGQVDLDTAVEYFTKAIDLGDDRGRIGLARAYMAGYGDENTSDELAYNAIENAFSNEKNALSSYYMAYVLENGIGTDVNISEAISLYEEVASEKDLDIYDDYLPNAANVRLGLIYMHGNGIESDYEKAKDYFEMAADQNYPEGLYYVGQLYENGIGVDEDYEKAMEYYEKAADLEYAPAQNQIGYMYYNGFGVEQNIDQAVYYQKLAAMQGYAVAQINLGYLYENGIGVEQNYDTAIAYYQMAANQNYQGAQEALLRVYNLNEDGQ